MNDKVSKDSPINKDEINQLYSDINKLCEEGMEKFSEIVTLPSDFISKPPKEHITMPKEDIKFFMETQRLALQGLTLLDEMDKKEAEIVEAAKPNRDDLSFESFVAYHLENIAKLKSFVDDVADTRRTINYFSHLVDNIAAGETDTKECDRKSFQSETPSTGKDDSSNLAFDINSDEVATSSPFSQIGHN